MQLTIPQEIAIDEYCILAHHSELFRVAGCQERRTFVVASTGGYSGNGCCGGGDVRDDRYEAWR